MILVSIALALTTLKYFAIPLTVFAFFGGALAIGLGFGTQTLIKNFISGIIVLFERKIRVGDIVELDATTSGKVVEINTRSSVLRNGDGKETLVPNSLFLESRVTNLTLSNRRIRRLIRVGVSYGSSPSQVATILKECVDRHGLVLKDPGPVVVFEDFGDNALLFVIYFWTEFNDKTDAGVVASDIRIMIEKRFAEAGIGFPFPQRDLHLKADEPLKIQVVTGSPAESWPTKKPTIP
jgi:small-conductance mechanosensitive channel